MHILELSCSGTIGTYEMGPVSTVICELANQFAAQGHEVTLIDVRAATHRVLLNQSICVINVDCEPVAAILASSDGWLSRQYRSWRHAYDFLRDGLTHLDCQHFDIIHVHNSRIALLLHRCYGLSYVLTCHNHPLPINKLYGYGSWIGQLAHGVSNAINRYAISHASLVIGLGKYLLDSFPGISIEVIPNGIDLSKWPEVDRSKARNNLGIDQQEFVVVFAGRIHPTKGVETLIKATELACTQIEKLRVLVIGSLSGTYNACNTVTSYAQRMLHAAEGLPVQFLGFISNKETEFHEYLAAADVVVVPSHHEPQGLVVLEALAMGTPVVASNVGGISAMIDSQIGCLIPAADATTLAHRLYDLYHDPIHRRSLAARCRQHVAANWSWQNAAKQYLEVFGQQVNNTVSAPNAGIIS